MFRLDQVVIRRGGRHVLGPISLDLPGPGPVVLQGPSGCGKSSLLRLLNRLDVPAEGRVLLHEAAAANGEVDLAELEPTALRRRVAMVFQRPTPLTGTVADNLRAADPALDDGAIGSALARVGLPADVASRDARDLSGGEAQRMCLARALATNPEIVLFDEPTSSLDPDNATRIEDLALDLAAAGTGVVWVTHDPEQAERLATVRIDLGGDG